MKYDLIYRSKFWKDLTNTSNRITEEYDDPIAAERLANDVEKAILERSEYPFTHDSFIFMRKNNTTFYSIRVRNYYIIYTIKGNTMRIRRFVYARRNIYELL